MITKNIKYGKIENVDLIQFGFGTIRIVSAKGEDYEALLFGSNKEPKEIGELGEKFPTSDDFNPEVVIAFHNEESFSVFEKWVKQIRKEYNKSKANNSKK